MNTRLSYWLIFLIVCLNKLCTVIPMLNCHSKEDHKFGSRIIIAKCRSKVLHAILTTCIKLSLVIKIFVFYIFLSGRFTHVLLFMYSECNYIEKCEGLV